MLIIIGLLILPTGIDFPGEKIISDKISPSSPGFNKYVTTFNLIQSIDNIFIIGWFISWVSISAIVRTQNK